MSLWECLLTNPLKWRIMQTKYVNELEEKVFVQYLFQFLEDAIRRNVDVRKMLEIVERDHKIAHN